MLASLLNPLVTKCVCMGILLTPPTGTNKVRGGVTGVGGRLIRSAVEMFLIL